MLPQTLWLYMKGHRSRLETWNRAEPYSPPWASRFLVAEEEVGGTISSQIFCVCVCVGTAYDYLWYWGSVFVFISFWSYWQELQVPSSLGNLRQLEQSGLFEQSSVFCVGIAWVKQEIWWRFSPPSFWHPRLWILDSWRLYQWLPLDVAATQSPATVAGFTPCDLLLPVTHFFMAAVFHLGLVVLEGSFSMMELLDFLGHWRLLRGVW